MFFLSDFICQGMHISESALLEKNCQTWTLVQLKKSVFRIVSDIFFMMPLLDLQPELLDYIPNLGENLEHLWYSSAVRTPYCEL